MSQSAARPRLGVPPESIGLPSEPRMERLEKQRWHLWWWLLLAAALFVFALWPSGRSLQKDSRLVSTYQPRG